jgi:uncharacterized protein (DUF1778 family)
MKEQSNTLISSLLADTIQSLAYDSKARVTEQGFTNINIRPTPQQAAMLETIAKIRNRNPTSMMASDISVALADMLVESQDFLPLVWEVSRRQYEKSGDVTGALKVLEDKNVIGPKPMSQEEYEEYLNAL